MKTFLKKASAAVFTLGVMVSSVVFDVPGTMTVRAAAAGGCSGDHSAATVWSGSEPLENDGSYYLEAPVKLSEETEIEGNVTLCLNGLTITAASGSRIFRVKEGGSLTLCSCKEDGMITGGDNDYGGAVYVEKGGTFTLSGGTISGSSAKQGGGVYNAGVFNMNGGVISENNSDEGGGVYLNSESAEFEMTGGMILKNTAGHEGGGVYVSGSNKVGVFTMSGGAISGNTVKYKAGASDNGGGGVYTAGSFKMSGSSKISGNTAGTAETGNYCMGGGVCVSGTNAEFIMNGGTLSGNKAVYGGGVYVSTHGTFKMTGGTIGDANDAVNGGGGVGMGGGEFLMSGGTISKNTTERRGGGVYIDYTGKFTMSSGTISDNESRDGGGVHLANGEFTMNGGMISDNTSSRDGGGVHLANGKFTMSSGTISDNESRDGGGVHLANGELTMSGGSISDNTSSRDGGGVHLANGEFIMSGGTVSDNTASSDGGGVHLANGEFTMSSGTISDNTSSEGGGVYLRGGAFTMSGGAISDNTAKNVGSCVYVGNENGGGTMTLNGKVEISSQTESNVYLRSGKTITIGQSFSTVRKIGIHPEDEPSCMVFVPATTFDSNVTAADISADFKADLAGQSILYDNKLGRVELKGEHKYDDTKWKTDPDYHWHECTICHLDKKEVGEHDWDDGEVTKEPTCTDVGEKIFTCEVCKLTKKKDIPAGHSYDDTKWINDFDYHWHECTECGDKKDKEKHDWDDGEVTKEPTCTEEGEKTFTCEVCGCTKKKPIPAEHKYDTKWENDPDYHWHECTECGDKKDAAKHHWSGGVVTKEPTYSESGEITYICIDCKRKKTEVMLLNDPGNSQEPEASEAPEDSKAPENSENPEDSKEPEVSKESEDSKASEDTKIPDNSGDPNYPGDSSATDDSNSSTESSTDSDSSGGHDNAVPDNPSTGIAISLVSLASAVTALTAILMRKKK